MTRSARWASTPLVWTVANNVPANTFASSSPGRKTRAGEVQLRPRRPGSVSHLVPEVILDGAGMQAVPVPFKGGGPAAQAVAGGHVAVVASSLPVAKAQIEGKLVKGLFVTSDKRSPALPDVPTLQRARLSSSPTWSLNSGGACSCRRARRSRSGPSSKRPCKTTMANPAVRERLTKVDTDPSFAPGAGAQGQARERDQELVEVHRRQGHQGRAVAHPVAVIAGLARRSRSAGIGSPEQDGRACPP